MKRPLFAAVAVAPLVLVSLIVLPLTVAVIGIGTALPGEGAEASSSGGEAGAGAVPSGAGIPAAYLADFEVSGSRFGVPWGVLAGIYRLECDFGESRLAGCSPPGTENGAGAQGPGQFLAPTWRRALAPGQIITPGPPTASNVDGYATDGDGDGVADPWDPADAVASSARLLAANGAGRGDLFAAVFSYNHDEAYVDQVLALAAGYQQRLPSEAAASGGVASVLAFAQAQLGKPYLWGGAGPDRWDCSGLVQAAYRQVGVLLEHDAAEQYAATAGGSVAFDRLEPGDLVFYGTSAPAIHHVGIYVGGGNMIDAPHTGAFVRIDSIAASDLFSATRPLEGT